MTLLIDGVDFTPYIAYGGLKWSRNDIDAPNTGRAMNGLMYRGRVDTKIRLDITCRMLKGSELRLVLNTILPEYVTVIYDDPMYGPVEKTMYSNNNPAVYQINKNDGSEWWSGVTFPLIER
ncbi:MAG: hypothetical protein J6S14_02040 [Clostridia bacterium]|nr:hypothetical protein [Clostridia bacterium]